MLEIDGHDTSQILEAFGRAQMTEGRPTVILAHTVKGKGVSFMENKASWHGIAPDREQFEKAMVDLQTPSVPRRRVDTLLARAAENAARVERQTKDPLPRFTHDYWWNAGETMQVEMDPTRMGFGRGLERAGPTSEW